MMGRSVKAALVVCFIFTAGVAGWAGVGCGGGMEPASSGDGAQPSVLAGTGFLADIAQNVAGSRAVVTSLLPAGTDPHSFEPKPRDVRDVARSRAIIINSPGFEPVVDSLIESAGRSDVLVIEAAAGLAGRTPRSGEKPEGTVRRELNEAPVEIDPHFWFDPLNVVTYVANIEKGLSTIDEAGAEVYARNAEAYTRLLYELDAWISGRVTSIPAARKLLVTNHESLGYFADRYGFRIVGTVFPTLGEGGTPSAKQLVALVAKIRDTGAPAVFLETGSSGDLARQIAGETGVEVVTGLYTHSLGVDDASTYLDMMRWNVELIVEALR